MFIYCGNLVGKSKKGKRITPSFCVKLPRFSYFFPSFFVNDFPGFLLVFSKMLLESLLTHLVSKDYELMGRLVMHQSFVSTPHHLRGYIAVE